MEFRIMRAMCELERNTRGPIFAWMIQANINVSLCEQTIRRKMVELAKRGKLIRLGPRKGYILNRV